MRKQLKISNETALSNPQLMVEFDKGEGPYEKYATTPFNRGQSYYELPEKEGRKIVRVWLEIPFEVIETE